MTSEVFNIINKITDIKTNSNLTIPESATQKDFWKFLFLWNIVTFLSLFLISFLSVVSFAISYDSFILGDKVEGNTLTNTIITIVILISPGSIQSTFLSLYFSKNRIFSLFSIRSTFWILSYVIGIFSFVFTFVPSKNETFSLFITSLFVLSVQFMCIKRKNTRLNSYFYSTILIIAALSLMATAIEFRETGVALVSGLFLNTAIGAAVFILLANDSEEHIE